ncbi:hypothetical protein ACJMK2_031732 [Sinanodonta woodiana]|uniref:Uncharacterized protein n=1 Tax=Sinanodonta woodiana TaxID=1069815 RepID=A0ABD3WZP6_SINWO
MRRSTVSGTEKDIIHAIAGKQFMIRTWSMIGSNMSITVKMDNNTILNMSLCEGNDTNSTFQNSSMMLIYNTTIQEVYLLFENISKEDGGMYEIKENLYRTNTISDDNETDTYDRKDGTWYLEIYVLDSSEIKDGYVGANISMTFEIEMLKEMYTLQNYDLHGALLVGSTCSILTDSSLYGRLRCSAYDSGRMYTITIENISQRDAGLYKISHRENATGRCFFSIKESPTCAIVGENKTIGWFYNQQGIKRALRIIHPNQGVMMLVNQTNSPKIKSDFQHRLLYNGDILQSFMSFTLLNVTQSDAGSYIIETLHGNTIPGSKELNVEVQRLVVGKSEVMLIDTPSIRTRHPYRTHLKEEWVSRLTLSNDLIHHPDVAIPSKSCVFGTTGSNTVFLSEVEGNNHGVTFITEHNGLSNMTNGKIIIARSKFSEDGNLPSYPSVYALAKATVYEDGCTSVVEGMGTRQLSEITKPLRGNDIKRPTFAYSNMTICV